MVFGKLGDDAAERSEFEWLAAHEVGVAASQSGRRASPPRLKKNYDGRAFRLLELTLHNAMEQRMANASPQKHIDTHMDQGKKLLADNRYGEAEHELRRGCPMTPKVPRASAGASPGGGG